MDKCQDRGQKSDLEIPPALIHSLKTDIDALMKRTKNAEVFQGLQLSSSSDLQDRRNGVYVLDQVIETTDCISDRRDALLGKAISMLLLSDSKTCQDVLSQLLLLFPSDPEATEFQRKLEAFPLVIPKTHEHQGAGEAENLHYIGSMYFFAGLCVGGAVVFLLLQRNLH